METQSHTSLPKSAYLRLLEYQMKSKPRSFDPDIPLIIFITLSRISSGLGLTNPFFTPSIKWIAISLIFMFIAIIASILHLNVPKRFLTMIRNNRSYLVWEVRLAGAMTLGFFLELLSKLGHLRGDFIPFGWLNLALSFFFIISTGLAYRFDCHPSWKSPVLPIYYIVSAVWIGTIIHSVTEVQSFIFILISISCLFIQVILLLLYRKHLKRTSHSSLSELISGNERWFFLLFIWTNLLLPLLFTTVIFLVGGNEMISISFVISLTIGIFLERILFFRVERPNYFLSFIENPERIGNYWIRG